MSQVTDPDVLLRATEVVINHITGDVIVDGELFPFKLNPERKIEIGDDGLRGVVTLPVLIVAEEIEVIR